LVTADIGKHRGKTIPLKDIINEAIAKLDWKQALMHVLIWEGFCQGTISAPTYEVGPRMYNAAGSSSIASF
jgi:hypothetical protein